MGRIINLTGQKFERLTVLRDTGKDGHGDSWMLCICSCGKNKKARFSHLKSGGIRSCGCLQQEIRRKNGKRTGDKYGGSGTRTHNHSGNYTRKASPTYISWQDMKTRCLNPDEHHKKYYNNITICSRWRNSFENFLQDMGERPEGKTIDRIDNEGNYTPDNCKWSTHSEQMLNRRSWKRTVTNKGGDSSLIVK